MGERIRARASREAGPDGLMGQYESSSSRRAGQGDGGDRIIDAEVTVESRPRLRRFTGLRQCQKSKAVSLDSDSDCEVVSSEQWQEAALRKRPNSERKRQRAAGSSPNEARAAKKAKVQVGESLKRNGAWEDRKPKRPRTRNDGIQDVTMEDVGAETSSKRPRGSPKSGLSPLAKKQRLGDEHRFVPSKGKVRTEGLFFEPQDHCSGSSDSDGQSSKRGPGPTSAERSPKRQKRSLLSDATEGRDFAAELSQLSMRTEGPSTSAPAAFKEDGFRIREEVKQTTEFKEADEQEWLLRQREIERQAREAQKLKKKLKAEAERKLEMENRQRQRLAEIRETQKQEQNAMDQKERIRAEVQGRLELMSSTCGSLGSLLQRLGIAFGGGDFPTVEQVNAGYKKALLKFHPDRASQGDLRCQVEAEEKFKLISRMKNVLKPI